ncbi:sigma-70 family RNA polymerase sigma factor [Nonomuraea sp. MCN248]|uniref:Sigma-70 family RNA polymerase sigma factor n=1 Tax=Nonomuraea corallina TaxID=2989783 RepID=A0ABT4SNZ1_9ACTN|nr:sigma-70 family RNA polymerase sigma factor [Nonomuraea corallina]MDA0638606.1 sigma-70 family RNA polymerase sigma factor [Nonomuraea corallina]
MRDDPSVVALVTRARTGDKDAWDEIVERYAPLVWSICRTFRLSRADADDVGQTVWLSLVEQLPRLREPAALPGWLVTATRRECLRCAHSTERQQRLSLQVDQEALVDERAPAPDQDLLDAERNAALMAGLRQLSARCRELLGMLIRQPPAAYAEISEKLSMPVGAIGPTRARCLAKLRRSPAVAALIRSEQETREEGERHGHAVVEGRRKVARRAQTGR